MDDKYKVDIAFGKGTVPIYADPDLAEWQIIRPKFEKPLPDAGIVFHDLCSKPTGCPPLKEIVKPNDRVVIVTSDGTRPVPNKKLIPWILKELPVPDGNVTIIIGTGTHRPNSSEEIIDMFGEDIAKKIKIVNHDAYKPEQNKYVGKTSSGGDVYLDKIYLEADKRIVVGFIEPHFFAGFSGGAKGIVPGVAGIETILHLHSAKLIADSNSTWAELKENPIQHEIAEMVKFCPPEFMVNVTLNTNKEITGFFIGHYEEAHRKGCKHVKENSMIPVSHKFPIVVTSNSGYPLDQNLYQTVKGMSAAARIVEENGIIIIASECSDGIPSHGNFAKIMQVGSSHEDVLDWIFSLKKTMLDQWQAQILVEIMKKAKVLVFSRMDKESIKACKLSIIDELQLALNESIKAIGKGARVAVLPDGPLNIPFVSIKSA